MAVNTTSAGQSSRAFDAGAPISAAVKRILLVEDSPTQAARLSTFLEKDGIEVVKAASGEIALKILETIRPDVIVLDNYLPSMTGNEFCREIRLNVNTRAIPVLMLTSEDSDAAETQGLASGADDFVTKTVDPDILRARIRALMRNAEPDPVVPDVENHFTRARILVIDDSIPYLHIIRDFLVAEHYQVEISGDPQEGLRRFSESTFDCVIVDFEMPLMNGPEVCQRIRASDDHAKSGIVLVLYSSHEEKARMTEAFDAGADDYISKSADLSVAKARIRALLRRKFLTEENRRISEEIRQKELDAVYERAQHQMLDREMEIAREVQQRLFPQSLPFCPTLDYAARCRPARGVGGDYYDFLALPERHLGISIGDVSGKGVPAALLMASLQASVRGQAFIKDQGVSGLISNVNRIVLAASPEAQYATFFYAEYDPVARRLTYSNAGHNQPMLVRDTKIVRLGKGGAPVGLIEGLEYEEETIDLQPGDLLVLFTDGISDAENSDQKEWGEKALKEVVSVSGEKAPADMIEAIISAADAFVGDVPQHDDMTVVVARVR